ncbi:helical backbone metal receptor [Elizabethkingia sp. JS20170427COW]|uniref:helical backbone metal receptor n=1 Tax=Elizabethkingia sp. JS20170427COW TaxID=2583851 RepID=UPI001110BB35|nr:helical backbone metal receptor [Elizabethkingia sp. JS20170427COW]QCX53848.1 cobalamin-binding protein [Elizabethkingia sp. JS20170427COW]
MKIISLVPSITETLLDLGVESLVGRTKFCIHPRDKVSEIPIVGGTKNIKIDFIKSLQPDLIIANKEENVKEQVELLMEDFPVWVTDIETLQDNNAFLKEVGDTFHKEKEAKVYIEQTQQVFKDLPIADVSLKVAYLIWRNPYMSVGRDTYIHEILTHLNLENICKNLTRYPQIEMKDLEKADVILLSTEPYPFSEKHFEEFQNVFPNKKTIIVDGEVFSWYGTHLAKSKGYLRKLANQLLQISTEGNLY